MDKIKKADIDKKKFHNNAKVICDPHCESVVNVYENEIPENLFRFFKINFYDLVSNPQNIEPFQLAQISESLRHPSIRFLRQTFDFNESILKMCTCLLQLNLIEIDNEILNDYFWKFSTLRLTDPDSRNIIQYWLENFEKIEKFIEERLKEFSKSKLTCFECKENQVSILYLPCGHLVTCGTCFVSSRKHCQVCETPIDNFHLIYL